MNLSQLIPPELVVEDMKATEKKLAIRELLAHLVQLRRISAEIAKKLERAVIRRESQGSTGIGKGLAIPHMKNCSHVSEVMAIFGRAKAGIPFDAIDGEPVHLLFLVISPSGAESDHVAVMKKIASIGRDEKTNRYLTNSEDLASITEIFKEVDGIE